jgi:hypothetical protein
MLRLNNKNNSKKHAHSCKLNNTLLNDQCEIYEIKEEIRRFLEANENENMTNRNLWEIANAILRGKFIAMSAYSKVQNNLKLMT